MPKARQKNRPTSLLTEEHMTKARELARVRPAVLPGTRAILDPKQQEAWHKQVTEAIEGFGLTVGQMHEFCNIAGVAD